MSRPPSELRRRRRLPWVAVPAAAYLSVTLAVPLANGATLGSRFTEHALTTLLVAGAIGLAFALCEPR